MTEEETLQEMVRRLVEATRPDRIALFGSRARGDAGAGCDFDLLVIAPSDLPRWRRTPVVYRPLAGMGAPKDIVWYTPEEAAEWEGMKPHLVIAALPEGRALYERAT